MIRFVCRRRGPRGTLAVAFIAGLAGVPSSAVAQSVTLGSRALAARAQTEGVGKVRPTSYTSEGFPIFRRIRWASWGGAKARGVGVDVPDGPFASSQVELVAYDRGPCDGHLAYRHLAAKYPGRKSFVLNPDQGGTLGVVKNALCLTTRSQTHHQSAIHSRLADKSCGARRELGIWWRLTVTGYVQCGRGWAIRAAFRSKGSNVIQHGSGVLATTYWSLTRYPGWTCGSGSGGGRCQRGSAVVGWEVVPTT